MEKNSSLRTFLLQPFMVTEEIPNFSSFLENMA